ncbi:ComEA family DNA-binding protein [Acidicapsa ligni]|uniref:ComEA family DNA-binding protein n=1 Tax=Acidicapsa ligni TaxID=542300 RepID=UPI0021E0D4EE|nr:helix-hairpin-helix domain-containing protein [Acidicapsa ligni]
MTAQSLRPQLIDLNRATVTELMTVSGMTQSWAGRIVRFRPYRTKLDLVDRGVITPDVYRRIRANIIAHRVASASSPTPAKTRDRLNEDTY